MAPIVGRGVAGAGAGGSARLAENGRYERSHLDLCIPLKIEFRGALRPSGDSRLFVYLDTSV